MKHVYRYLIGIAVGVGAGFLLPAGEAAAAGIAAVSEVALRIGTYLALPLIFFSLPVAITRLRRLKRLGALMGRTALYALGASALLVLIGTALAWSASFIRLPVLPGRNPDVSVVDLGTMVRRTIEFNGFRALIGDPNFLLPLLLPAFLLGWHMHHDREIAEPAFNVFDSLSRLTYRASRYALVLMPGLLAIIIAAVVHQTRQVVDFRRFLPLLGIGVLASLVLIGGIYPLILWLAGGRRSPWKTLAGLSGALIGALASASPLFNYGNFTTHLKERLGIRRHTAAVAAPFSVMFARAGTALLTAFCMLTVIRSYSSLEITVFQAAWTALFAFLVSFALPATPAGGLTAALLMIASLYGRGLDDGWLILAPILPLLGMLATVLDAATAAVLIVLVNRHTGLDEEA